MFLIVSWDVYLVVNFYLSYFYTFLLFGDMVMHTCTNEFETKGKKSEMKINCNIFLPCNVKGVHLKPFT